MPIHCIPKKFIEEIWKVYQNLLPLINEYWSNIMLLNSAYTCFKSQTTLTKDIELLEGKYPENLLEGRISRHSGQGYSFCQNMNGNLNWSNAIALQTNPPIFSFLHFYFIFFRLENYYWAMTIEWGRYRLLLIKYWKF